MGPEPVNWRLYENGKIERILSMRDVKRRPPSLCQDILSDPPSNSKDLRMLTTCLWTSSLRVRRKISSIRK